MNIVAELIDDARVMIRHRRRLMPMQKQLDRHAPKVEDTAPDFTLSDSTGSETITLSNFRGKQPVALVFGSYT